MNLLNMVRPPSRPIQTIQPEIVNCNDTRQQSCDDVKPATVRLQENTTSAARTTAAAASGHRESDCSLLAGAIGNGAPLFRNSVRHNEFTGRNDSRKAQVGD